VIDPFRRLPIDTVARIVCERYKAPVHRITSPSKSATISHIRMIIMYLANKFFKLTPREISNYLGNDRSTVVYGVKRVESLMASDEILKRDLDDLKIEIVKSLVHV
jgi:chromosomal replication initiator protein